MNRLGSLRAGFLLAVGVAGCPLAPASADPIPAATYQITFNNGVPLNGPGTFTSGDETGQAESFPSPLALAHVSGQGNTRVEIRYWFRVEGPSDGIEVPIQIEGRTAIDAGNPLFFMNAVWGLTAQLVAISYDDELLSAQNQIENLHHDVGCNPLSTGPTPIPPPNLTCPGLIQDEPVVFLLHTLTGADNEIAINVATNNQETEFSADFDAMVDPVISFAPGFDATGYSIALSDGVGNTVPEPGGVLMASTGLAVFVLMRRGRKPAEGRRAVSRRRTKSRA
jgi:hypothetical protein